MELVKSKGMIIFLIIVLSITAISSINNKKYDDKTNNQVVSSELENVL